MTLKNFYKECVRVLKVTKKPTMSEFKKIFQITGLGAIVIGLIGFLIMMVYMMF